MSKRNPLPSIEYSSPAKPIGSSGDSCADLSFTDDLGSIQSSALANVQPGDVCRIELNGSIPEVLNSKGEVCGRVISLRSMELVECLRKGHPFKAIILNITASTCSVIVESAKK